LSKYDFGGNTIFTDIEREAWMAQDSLVLKLKPTGLYANNFYQTMN